MACILVINILNLNLKKIEKKFIKFEIPEGRGDIHSVRKYNKNFKLIDESYNANPLSMMLAIKHVNNFSRKEINRKIVILGDMLELGNKGKKFHRKLSQIINKSDIDKVFVFGKLIKDTFAYISKSKRGTIFNNLKEANEYLSKFIHNEDLLMIKGSNATGLNSFAKNIKGRH